MRLMTSLVLGLLIACGDKEAEDTAVEAEEEHGVHGRRVVDGVGD